MTAQWWNNIDDEKPKYSDKITSPLSHYPSQIPHGLAWDWAQAFAVRSRHDEWHGCGCCYQNYNKFSALNPTVLFVELWKECLWKCAVIKYLADKLQRESLKKTSKTQHEKWRQYSWKKMNAAHNRIGSYLRITFRVSPTSTKKNFGAVDIKVVNGKVVHLW